MRYEPELIRLKDRSYGVLRSPSPAEGGRVLDLMRACTAETEYLIEYPEEISHSDESEAALIFAAGESEGRLLMVCDIEDELAGLCSLSCEGIAKSKIKHRAAVGICILKKYWGIGLGRAMMSAIEAQAKAAGLGQLELELIEGNERAMGLYSALGYRETGALPNAIRTRDGRSLSLHTMIKQI